MKKNLITEFVDWYILNSDRLGSSYYTKFFKEDRNVFISNISEYAVEYAISFNKNPFIIENNNIKEAITEIETNLKNKNTTFEEYSLSKSNHMPRAILGSKNYLKFLEENFLHQGTKKKIIGKSELQKKAIEKIEFQENINIYSNEYIRKNFFFRLITQDRFYEFLNFPISLLKKIFYTYDRSFFDNWINSQINNIQIHTEDKVINFSELQTLEIKKNGNIQIITKANKRFILHTPIAGEDIKREHLTSELRNVVIDHIIPFETILYNLKGNLPTFGLIHSKLKEINNGIPLTNRDELSMVGNLFIGLDYLDKIEIEDLKKEMNIISSNISLQLMDKLENLYKKKYKDLS
ncbi:MAG: hypothetical protein HXX18_14765 [Bacteroidetes bacterium]|nr:hypothetical protein [Bacteroidota bacterium]